MAPLVSVELPVNAAGTKRHYSVEETEAAAEQLVAGQKLSDGVVYDTPKGKLEPRAQAQLAAFHLRQDLIADGHFEAKDIRSRTFEDEAGGFRWAVFTK